MEERKSIIKKENIRLQSERSNIISPQQMKRHYTDDIRLSASQDLLS